MPTTDDAALSPEDEARPVVGFLRLAGWPDKKIAEVVAAHDKEPMTESHGATDAVLVTSSLGRSHV